MVVVAVEAIAEAMRIRGHLRLGRLGDPVSSKLVLPNAVLARRLPVR